LFVILLGANLAARRAYAARIECRAGRPCGRGGPGEFTAVERLLGGSFSGLAGIRRDPDAKIDAAGLTSDEIGDWLLALPVGQGAELHVAWTAERLGARMSFEMLAANIGDLWFPAMDDIVCVVQSGGGGLMLLVFDHEELITLTGLSGRLSQQVGCLRRVEGGAGGGGATIRSG
jgi:hypothetical protein